MATVGAGVILECFLGEAVEGERRHGAVQVRSSHAPLAVGAAPAAKVVTFDPDQAFVHTSTFCIQVWDRNQAANGWAAGTNSSAEGELLPLATVNLPWNSQRGKVTRVLRPIGQEPVVRGDTVRFDGARPRVAVFGFFTKSRSRILRWFMKGKGAWEDAPFIALGFGRAV